MTNDPGSQEQKPDGPCPDWCRNHRDGMHLGELELAKKTEGYNIYLRKTARGDGQVGLEVVVSDPDNPDATTRVDIDPEAVMESAMLSDLRRSLAAYDNGAPLDGGAGEDQR